MPLQAFGQRGQLVRELEQELQAVLLAQGEEVVADLGEGGGEWCVGAVVHRFGTVPGSDPCTMGTRTALPHSVHEPS